MKTVRDRYWEEFARGRIKEKDYWKNIFADLGIEENVDEFIKEAHKDVLKEIPGTREILRKLKRKRLLGAILSNHAIEWIIPTIYGFQLYKYFPIMVISCYVGLKKPERAIYELVLKELGTRPGETIYIDDQEKNLVPAQELGIKTIKFESAQQLEQELKVLVAL